MTFIFQDYEDISFKDGKEPGSLRKRATQFIELYNKTHKLIKIERNSIGDYPFDKILIELQQDGLKKKLIV